MKRLRALTLIFKSWPIRPATVTTITAAFLILVVSAVVVTLAENRGQAPQGQNLDWILALAFGYSTLGLLSLSLGKWLTARYPKFQNWIYHLTAFLHAGVVVLVRVLVANEETPPYWEQPISHIRLFMVILILYYVLHVSLGVSSYRISEEAKRANDAVLALETQRGKLIDSQEQTRKQIADFLHDRLQSDLVVLGLQINKAAQTLDTRSQEIANAFVDEIERIRQIDVREASRALAPELDGPTLGPALNDLVGQYRQVIDIQLALDQQHTVSMQQRLGVYRIVEQGLLNAAKHAAAKKVAIEIIIATERILIQIENDGAPLAEDFLPGSGFAIIENWVKLYRGTWKIASVDDKTRLVAVLHVTD
jgi:signal transduction histidine kinase